MTDPFESLRQRAKDLALPEKDSAANARDQENTRLLETELLLQQQELAESHQRMEALREHYYRLFEAAPVAFLRVSEDHQILELNANARQLLGISRTNREPVSLFHYVQVRYHGTWRELLRGQLSSAWLEMQGPQGLLAVEARTSRTSAETGVLVSLTDVTELSEARRHKSEADERFAAVVEQMREGLVVVNMTNGVIEDHNDAFAVVMGRPGQSLVGNVHDTYFPEIVRAVQIEALRQSRPSQITRIRYTRADGEEVLTDVSTGWLGEGREATAYHVVRDVSEFVRSEERRRALEDRLAEGHKLEALGQLAAGVAHDINNVLAVVLAATETTPTPEALRELRAMALRGRDLTGRLLSISRKQPLRREPFDLLEVVAEVVAIARRTFPKEIEIELSRPSGSWTIEGDPGQWQQSILNLVLNSRDALSNAGRIQLVARDEGERVVIEVRDNGAGMSSDVLRRAFEPFFTTKGLLGTGLGLSHVRAVVLAHGGEIRISSLPLSGTTVRIELPRSNVITSEIPRRQSSLPPQSEPGTTGRVLVVDDEVPVARAVSLVLESLGWVAEFVSSGALALARLEQQAWDIVLTDRAMPGMTGDELTNIVRNRWSCMPIVMMSGLGNAQPDSSPDFMIGKPFEAAEIDLLLRRALRSRPSCGRLGCPRCRRR